MVVWFLLVACSSTPKADTASPTASMPTAPTPTAGTPAGTPGGTPTDTPMPTGHTGDTAPPAPFTAACTLDPDNVLRAACALTSTTPSTFEVTLTEVATGQTRTFATATPTTAATVPLALMPPTAAHTWRAVATTTGEALDGAFVTGDLPPDADLALTQTAVEARSGHVVLPTGCGDVPTLVIVDPDARVVWYERFFDEGLADLLAADVADDVLVALLGRSTVIALALDGTRRVDVDVQAVLGRPLHHDVSVFDDRIHVLTAYATVGDDGDTYVVDGVAILDDRGAVLDTWDLTDWITPTGGASEALSAYWLREFAGAHDWSHGNTVQPGPDGTMLISFRHLHTVAQVRSDPADPAFGEVDWWVSTPDSVIATGRLLTAAPGFPEPHHFAYQHHATVDDRGRVLLFDNGDLRAGGNSRAVAMTVDDRTATLEEAWPLGDYCPFEGGAYWLGDDRVLITCASAGYATELAADGTEHRRLTARCPTGPARITRAVPWSPPDRIVWD